VHDIVDLRSDTLTLPTAEMREAIIDTVSQTGGHLGASLGAVEITVALHAELSSPRDRIIWDVGHQAYGHKLLTGRLEGFNTLRQYGGISGFLRRAESEHDVMGAGHASTSISYATGLAEGLRHSRRALARMPGGEDDVNAQRCPQRRQDDDERHQDHGEQAREYVHSRAPHRRARAT